MSKILMIVVMISMSTYVLAEDWTKVDDTEKATAYISLSTKRIEGDVVKVWALMDYKAPQRDGDKLIRSRQTRFAFNCKEEWMSSIALIVRGGNMGTGEILFSHNYPLKWEPIQIDSFLMYLFYIACAEK